MQHCAYNLHVNSSLCWYRDCWLSRLYLLCKIISFCVPFSITAALKKWHQVNGALPERIYVYRDGVGDGQLSAVFEHECSQILDAAKSISDNYK